MFFVLFHHVMLCDAFGTKPLHAHQTVQRVIFVIAEIALMNSFRRGDVKVVFNGKNLMISTLTL